LYRKLFEAANEAIQVTLTPVTAAAGGKTKTTSTVKPEYRVRLIKPNGTYFNATPTSTSTTGAVTYNFTAPVAGAYKVRVELANHPAYFAGASATAPKSADFNISIPKMTENDLNYDKQESFGMATAIAVSNVTSTSTARIDGTVTVTGGDLALTAKTITGDSSADSYDAMGNLLSADKNYISATAILNKQSVALKPVTKDSSSDTATRGWRSFANVGAKPTSIANPTDKKEPPTKGPSLTGAVAVAISHNQADAIIGDGAEIIVNGGNMTVEAYVEENIKANVNSHVNKPSESVSGAAAVFVGDYNNTAGAVIGDNSVVDVTGLLTVKSDSVIPNQMVLDDDWDEFKKKVNGFVETNSWIGPFTSFGLGEPVTPPAPAGPAPEPPAGIGAQIIQKIKDGTIGVVQEKATQFAQSLAAGGQNYLTGLTGLRTTKETELTEIMNFQPGILESPDFLQKFSTTFVSASAKSGIDEKYLQSQAKTDAEKQAASKKADQGWSFAFSGSVDVFMLHNEANARIGKNAEINQKTAYNSATQDVAVTANSSLETINMVGLPSLNIIQLLLGRNTILPPVPPAPVKKPGSTTTPTSTLDKAHKTLSTVPILSVPEGILYNLISLKDKGAGRTAKQDLFERVQGLMFPTKSGGSGLGVNFQHTGYTNIATATIDDSALVSSQRNVRVEANTHNLLLDLTAGGAAAEGFMALTGSGTSTDIDNTSIATVGDDAVIYARSNIIVNADTDNTLVTYTGSTTHGADLGIGVSVTINTIMNNVGAYAGDGTGSLPAVNIPGGNIDYNDAGAVTLTRSDSGGSWINDGYEVGDWIRVSNLNPAEDGLFKILNLNHTMLTLQEGVKSPGTGTAGQVAIQKMGRLQADGAAIGLNDPALQFDFIHDPNGTDRIVRGDGAKWENDGFYAGQKITIAGSAENNGAYEIKSVDGDTLYFADTEFRNEFSVTGVSIISDAGKVSVSANNSSVIVTTSQSGSPLLLKMSDSGTPPANTQNTTQKRSFSDKATGGQKVGVQEPGKIALNGTFSLVEADNTTHSHIDGGFIILSGSELGVVANDSTYLVNGSMAYAYAGDIGGAANIALNTVNRDTQAEIGSEESDPAGEVFVTDAENVNVHATNGGGLVSVAVSGVLQTSADKKPAQKESAVIGRQRSTQLTAQDKANQDKAKAQQDKEAKRENKSWIPASTPELSLSGNVSYNQILDSTIAGIYGGVFSSVTDAEVQALDKSWIGAYAGSASISNSYYDTSPDSKTTNTGKSTSPGKEAPPKNKPAVSGAASASVTINAISQTTSAYVDKSNCRSWGISPYWQIPVR